MDSTDIPDLIPETSYLIEDGDMKRTAEIFRQNISRGFSGLCISREKPDRLRYSYGLEQVSFIWLSSNADAKTDDVIVMGPTSITNLSQEIDAFLAAREKSLVLFTGIEYLSTQNGFKSVINLLYLLNDKIMSGNNILIVAVNPQAFTTQDLNLLRSEMSNLK